MTDTPLKHFSVAYEHQDKCQVVTLSGTDIDDLYTKLASAVAKHEARVAEVQYYQMLAHHSLDDSPAKRVATKLFDEIGEANVEELVWSQVTVDGVMLDGLGIDQHKFLLTPKIEQIPGPSDTMRPGLHAIVVEVSCEGDFGDLDESIRDDLGNCSVDGSHYFVFEHPDHDISASEAFRAGQDLFMEVIGNGYKEMGDFQFYTRAVSSTDHAAEFTHTHGIYTVEAEPTPAPAM